jgi:aminomethyltransferase
MKRTVFYDIHRNAGGRIIDFAGFEMPVEFSGINDEHITVRQKAGLFDVSHMGEIWVKGPNARNLVQRVTTNDVDKLVPGKIQYSCLPNGNGGIVDDLLVYMYDPQKYLLVVNASNIQKDWEWITSCNTMGAQLENASDKISQLALQGPLSMKILQKITPVNLETIPYYHFTTGEVAGVKEVIISNTGYTGAGGYELYCYNADGPALYQALMNAGKEEGIKPVGLAARDTLRLEMGFCLYGNDIDDTTSPIEAGLGWITKFTDTNDFINKDIFRKQQEAGTSRRLVGFELMEMGIPRQHYKLFNQAGEEIGEVTSGTMSPMLKKGIGMGYVLSAYSKPDIIIQVQVRNKMIPARLVKFPFYKSNP